MRLSPELNESLNYQCAHELRNVLIYTSIQSYFEELQLKNLAKYFAVQAQHEKEHFDMIVNYLNDRTGGKYSLPEIDQPVLDIQSVQTVGELYLRTEEETTESIEEIYGLALENRSFIDLPFLSKMLQEQVEEEDSAMQFKMRISMVKDLVLFDATFEA